MSKRNGDKSRWGRQRKEKIARRSKNRGLKRTLAQAKPAAN